MARVNEGSHIGPIGLVGLPAFTLQPQSVTALWPVPYSFSVPLSLRVEGSVGLRDWYHKVVYPPADGHPSQC